jgi:hypothetical protein
MSLTFTPSSLALFFKFSKAYSSFLVESSGSFNSKSLEFNVTIFFYASSAAFWASYKLLTNCPPLVLLRLFWAVFIAELSYSNLAKASSASFLNYSVAPFFACSCAAVLVWKPLVPPFLKKLFLWACSSFSFLTASSYSTAILVPPLPKPLSLAA